MTPERAKSASVERDRSASRIAKEIAADLLPSLRGALATTRRAIGHYTDSEDGLGFANSAWDRSFASGHQLPRSFHTNAHRPMFVDVEPEDRGRRSAEEAHRWRGASATDGLRRLLSAFAEPNSPKLRDANPSVVIVPGLGLFSFGKNKKEARITSEFFINAIHVMAGPARWRKGRKPPEIAATSQDGRSSPRISSAFITM